MDIRKEPLVNGHYYHVFSRSIAKFHIFNDEDDYLRILELFKLYRYSDFNYRYSMYSQLQPVMQKAIYDNLELADNLLVEIVAYCVMPTHIHLLLKQVADNGITKLMSKVLNSYARFFNSKYHRAGPLWEGKFKNVEVVKDEQLLHLTRYIHLNPTSADIVTKPEVWAYSSYREYLEINENNLCKYTDLIDLSPMEYKKFINDRKDYQKHLSKIKNKLIDNYLG